MLPDANIQAPDLSDWISRNDAARIMAVHPPYVSHAVLKYGIAYQTMFGLPKFYKPDVERAAKAIAEMRAKRDGISTPTPMA